MLWILGAIGGWSPDMDSLGGAFETLINGNDFSYDSFLIYHRQFSHSIIFLSVILFCTIWLLFTIRISYRKTNIKPDLDLHPLGEVPLEKNGLTLFSFFLMVAMFALYNNTTKFLATFLILTSLVFFAWTFIKIEKPLYGAIFFIGAISHHLLDAFKCEWNPFGPWNGNIEIGMFFYCRDNGTPIFRSIMTFVFEIVPLIIVAIIIIIVIFHVFIYNKEKKLVV